SMSHVDLHDSWNRIIKGRLETIPLTATPDQIMNEPHVKLLAEKLALELARARKKSHTKPVNRMSALGQKRT
ncbi:MAG: hypothetical protein O7D27_03330, partial [Alphaproteobacteria bacterium]|nr:hypothetical protein [Alphaproteobacteria bacterium]